MGSARVCTCRWVPSPGTPPALSDFCREYLQEFELGMYTLSRKLGLQFETLVSTHPEVASTRASIADHLKELGKFEAAEEVFDAALVDRRCALGPWHIDVGVTYRELGIIYKSECRYEEALVCEPALSRLSPAHIRRARCCKQPVLIPASRPHYKIFNQRPCSSRHKRFLFELLAKITQRPRRSITRWEWCWK